MQKAVLICFALFTGIFTCLATEKVTTKVYFGKLSKGCSGFGVCSAQTTTQSGQLAGTWQYLAESALLVLDISEMELEGHDGQIVNGRFIQEEAFTLPEELCRQLGAFGSLTILAGKYAVRATEGRFIISFSVREG